MTYPTPTQPGYWWAKIIDREDGDPEWQIVHTVQTHVKGSFKVIRMDGGDSDYIEAFTFGPEVVKPEGLE